jgi:hypothetical protein
MANTSGAKVQVNTGGAFALAAILAENSPTLGATDKDTLKRIFIGNRKGPFPAGRVITVKADNVHCRSSDVAVGIYSCDLIFDSTPSSLHANRRSHELYATLAEVGVAASGAAGSIHEEISNVICTIYPNVVVDNSGGGASCTFTDITRSASAY